MKFPINMLALSFVLMIGGCTIIALDRGGVVAECEKIKQNGSPKSEIEQRLIRNHALMSATLLLETDYGTPDKFLTIYRMCHSRVCDYTLVFHFVDRYDYDLLHEPLMLGFDNGNEIHLGIEQDAASVTIGNVSDQYFSVTCSQAVFASLASSRIVKGSIEHINFRIPYECREEWRTIADK